MNPGFSAACRNLSIQTSAHVHLFPPDCRSIRLVDRHDRPHAGMCPVRHAGLDLLYHDRGIWYLHHVRTRESWLMSECCQQQRKTIHLRLLGPRRDLMCLHHKLADLQRWLTCNVQNSKLEAGRLTSIIPVVLLSTASPISAIFAFGGPVSHSP